jgi:hypothetical protein
LDDDEIKTNPAFIPKAGQFYMHDVRSGEPAATEESTEKNERQSRADVEKWSHDLYNEQRQQPKSDRELNYSYGHVARTQQGEDTNQPPPVSSLRGGRRLNFGGNKRRPHNRDNRPHGNSENRERLDSDQDMNREQQRPKDTRRQGLV